MVQSQDFRFVLIIVYSVNQTFSANEIMQVSFGYGTGYWIQ